MLKNKAGLRKYKLTCGFSNPKVRTWFPLKTPKKKVLGATSDGKVIQEVFVEDKTDQLWKKGKPDVEGYFTLENSGVPKVITAIFKSGLEIKGNITLRWILLVDYLPCMFFLHIDQNLLGSAI